MLTQLLIVAAGLVGQAEATPRATEAEIRRAFDMISGSWEFASVVDSGEALSLRLVSEKQAKGGRITIKERTLRLVDPKTGELRIVPMTVNPATNPRQVDLATEAGGTLRGIYRFEGDDLVVCLNHEDGASRPTEFEAPGGTNRMLVRFTLAPAETATTSIANDHSSPVPLPGMPGELEDIVAVTEVSAFRPAAGSGTRESAARVTLDEIVTPPVVAPTPETRRRASESELRRAHQLLAGTWQLESVVDDGETLGSELIRRKMAANGIVTVNNRIVQTITPSTGEARISAYRIDPTTEPRRIDIVTELDSVKKGIYRFDGDELIVCLNHVEDGPRPSTFDAPTGSNFVLMRLRMADATTPKIEPKPVPVDVVESRPRATVALAEAKPTRVVDAGTKPAATPPAEVTPTTTVVERVPSAAEQAAAREARVRELLVGSWVQSDESGSLTTVLRPDGSFVATRNWSKQGRKLFGPSTATMQGRWSYGQGLLKTSVMASTAEKYVGNAFVSRVQSIGNETMVATDFTGKVRSYRKMR